MSEGFFEGKKYQDGKFKGLIPKYYPKKYKNYIKDETKLLKQKLKGVNRVLEAGVGIGRLIPEIAPLVKEFVGIDNSNFMLKESIKVAGNYSNVRIIMENIENISEKFPKNYFDYSLCIWNTLGNVKSQVKVLEELNKVTKNSIIITVFLKGKTKDRLDFYKHVNVEVEKIDKNDETFYLNGYTSKTFNMEDIKNLAEKSGLRVKNFKILGGVILWAELIRNSNN